MNKSWEPATPPPVDYMAESMRLWVEHGMVQGSFAMALLENNLRSAFERADDNNTRHMRQWVIWCVMNLPASCWGSPEAVKAWSDHGGIRGLRARKQAEAKEANLRG